VLQFVTVLDTGANSYYLVYASGTSVGQTYYNATMPCASSAVSLAFDNTGTSSTTANAIFTTPTGDSTCEASGSGSVVYAVTGENKPERVASDNSSNAWVTLNGGNDVAKISTTGSSTTYSGGGLSAPFGVAVDGLGDLWLANTGNSSLTELTSSGTAVSPLTGYKGGTQNGSLNLAIDGAGNVWVTNHGASSVTELIGAAAPVQTPLSAAVAANMLGKRP